MTPTYQALANSQINMEQKKYPNQPKSPGKKIVTIEIESDTRIFTNDGLMIDTQTYIVNDFGIAVKGVIRHANDIKDAYSGPIPTMNGFSLDDEMTVIFIPYHSILYYLSRYEDSTEITENYSG